MWQNPHIRSRSARSVSTALAQLWLLEGQNPTDLDRARIPRDIIKVGDTVKFAGNASTRRERRMYVTNVLLQDETELVLRANAPPRWSPDRYLSHRASDRGSGARGRGPRRRHLPRLAADRFQDAGLGERSAAHATPRARHGRRTTPCVTTPSSTARPPGMPQVITRSGRYAIRFVQMGDDIVLKNEYREIDRVIHMTADAAAAERRAPTPLGYSTGKWDGESLVVTTTDIDWPYFQLYGLEGVPQSSEMKIVERFTPSADGKTLSYDISATDPQTFTQTVTAEGYRTFRGSPASSSCRRTACSSRQRGIRAAWA